MRVSRKDVRRASRSLPEIRFADQDLTSYGGLIVLDVLLRALEVHSSIDRAVCYVKTAGAYAASRIVNGSTPQPQRLSDSQIRQEFGPLFAALPGRPKSFLLYFLEGSDEFTPESLVELEKMLAELRQRGAPDVVVIGHTDRVGSLQFNDRA